MTAKTRMPALTSWWLREEMNRLRNSSWNDGTNERRQSCELFALKLAKCGFLQLPPRYASNLRTLPGYGSDEGRATFRRGL